jgi:hypothetical protein
MEADVVNLGKEIERLEKQATIDAELAKPTSSPLTNLPGNTHEPEGERPAVASDAYKKAAFWDSIRKKNYYDVTDALAVGTDTEGGYLVPDEFEKTSRLQALQDQNFFRTLATIIQTSSGERKIPVVTGHGEAAWMDEGGLYPESDDTFGQVTISATSWAPPSRFPRNSSTTACLISKAILPLSLHAVSVPRKRKPSLPEMAPASRPACLHPPKVQSPQTGTAITFDDVMDLYHSLPQRLPQQGRMDSERYHGESATEAQGQQRKLYLAAVRCRRSARHDPEPSL